MTSVFLFIYLENETPGSKIITSITILENAAAYTLRRQDFFSFS